MRCVVRMLGLGWSRVQFVSLADATGLEAGPTSTHDAPAQLYQQFIALSRQACAAGQYAVAFHALAAALHCAIDAGDVRQVRELETIAEEQIDWIDTHPTSYRLGTLSTTGRGGHDLWMTLALQATSYRHMLEGRPREKQA